MPIFAGQLSRDDTRRKTQNLIIEPCIEEYLITALFRARGDAMEKDLYFDPDEDIESIVVKLVAYMESRGISFRSVSKKKAASYGIMGGLTSVSYRKKEGVVLYCAKDGIDKTRIATTMHKKVLPNGEATRPYKLAFTQEEFPEAVTLLLLNAENRQWK